MLTGVEVYNDRMVKLSLPLNDSGEYIVKSITGLDPVNASIVTADYAYMDGGAYQTANVSTRNIVLTLGYNPSYTTSDPIGTLRRSLYSWFKPKMRVELRFLSSNFETVKCVGYVETFETVMFSADPEVQISILCPDPGLYSLSTTTIPFVAPVGKTATITVNNPGDENVGFALIVENYYSPTMSGFTVTRTSPDVKTMQYIEAIAAYESTIAVKINTVKGAKSAAWKLQSTYNVNAPFGGANILGYINGWLELYPGQNLIKIDYNASFTPVSTTASLSFIPKYAGL